MVYPVQSSKSFQNKMEASMASVQHFQIWAQAYVGLRMMHAHIVLEMLHSLSLSLERETERERAKEVALLHSHEAHMIS